MLDLHRTLLLGSLSTVSVSVRTLIVLYIYYRNERLFFRLQTVKSFENQDFSIFSAYNFYVTVMFGLQFESMYPNSPN